MKRFAAMCLIASMIASMGSVTGYAAEADGAGQTAVYQTADSASDETEVSDVSTAAYPSDWDPEDPLNGRHIDSSRDRKTWRHPMKRLTVLRPVSWHEAAAT